MREYIQKHFAKLLLKEKLKKSIYCILENSHSKECNGLYLVNLKNETNLIGNYNDFINKCFTFLDSQKHIIKKNFQINCFKYATRINIILN